MPIEIAVGKEDKAKDNSKFSFYTKDDRYKNREIKVLLEGGILIVALFFGLLLRLYAYEGVLVTSGSMSPTISKGDYMLVDHRIALRGQWKRGDVVLFKSPKHWNSAGQNLVKRIVGLPNENIRVYGGKVFVNGLPLTEDYLPRNIDAEIIHPIQLGPKEYLVLGDNRNFSDDSRDNGPIAESDIRGRAISKLWPLSQMGALIAPTY
jgi:signal peptidase I